jgi:molybdopterin converting factor small subunit
MSATRTHKANGGDGVPANGAAALLPADVCARLVPPVAPESPEAARAALAVLGLCDPARPAVTLELYGGLRLRTGCRALPLHAGTVREALDVLREVYPKSRRLMPDDGAADGHYRFSINGRDVTADEAHVLRAGDQVIVFSASVGG